MIYQIYLIKCNTTKRIYIGHTISDLSERLKGHEKDFNRWKRTKKRYISSFEVLKSGNYFIKNIKWYFCWEKMDILEKEGKWIKKFKEKYGDKCVNINEAGNNYKLNYDLALKRQADKLLCECGLFFRRNDKSRHIKTKRHLRLIRGKEI